MLDDYAGIFVLLIVAAAFFLFITFIGHRFGPRRPRAHKAEPYEPGITTLGPTRRQVPIKLFRVAVLFVLFDVQVVFMYPWAVLFHNADERAFLFVEMLIFMALLLVGLAYAWKVGALEWD